MRCVSMWIGEHAFRLAFAAEPAGVAAEPVPVDEGRGAGPDAAQPDAHRLYAGALDALSAAPPALDALARGNLWGERGEVSDVVAGWNAVTVYLRPSGDLARSSAARRDEFSREFARAVEGRISRVPQSARAVKLRACYGSNCGPDLEWVAAHAGLSPNEAAERHSAGDYGVRMVGFSPGFAYLEGLDPGLAAPRKATPRQRVEPGSIGIAGGQTGVYSLATPGGWQIVGRVLDRFFDLGVDPPETLRPGDRVRFVRTLCPDCEKVGKADENR